MNDNNDRAYRRHFELIRDIVTDSANNVDISDLAGLALDKAMAVFDLTAVSFVLWDDEFQPVISVSRSRSGDGKTILMETEQELLADLRRKKKLVSAYLAFAGEKPHSAFSLPIKKGEEIFGAIIGLHAGENSLVDEDAFLKAVAAALSSAMIVSQANQLLDREITRSAQATVTTVNHFINNYLQAILGNVQLLTRDDSSLSDDLKKKLKVIEQSAGEIMLLLHR